MRLKPIISGRRPEYSQGLRRETNRRDASLFSKAVARRFVLIFAPLMLATAAAMVLFYRVQASATQAWVRELAYAYAGLGLMFAAVAGAIAYLGARRRQAEEAQTFARVRYEDLVNNLNVGVYRSTPEPGGRFLEVNPAMVQLFGASSQEQLLACPVAELYVDSAAREAFSKKLTEAGTVVDEEFEFRRLTGERFWVSITAVKKSGPGGEVYFDGVLADITARKRAEQALRANEARFRAVAETANDGIVSADRHGSVIYINKAAERIFGYTAAEIIGEPLTVLMPERYRATHSQAFAWAVAEGGLDRPGPAKELEGRRKDGSEFPLELSLASWKIGEEVYFTAILRDITQRWQAEAHIQALNESLARRAAELEAVNRELEAFSYSVSHDLRAPLRSIDGFSQALLEDYGERLDAGAWDYLKRVRAGAQRMGTLIDDLLKLSRVTRAELHLEEVEVSALAWEIARELREREPQRRVEFIVAPGLEARADPRLLRIALENLLDNAWKFTGTRTEAKIRVGATQQGDLPAYFVRDNGVGFDMAYAGKLFGAFQRLHDSREFPGTGIGLATVQRVVHKHGGRVWAEGAVDRGASFYFTLQL